MNQTTQLHCESLLPTASLEFPHIKAQQKMVETGTARMPGVVVRYCFDAKQEEKLPIGYTDIDDLAIEFEQDETHRAAIEEGRRWVADAFYADKPVTLSTLRLKKGWSQTRLAEELRTSQPHVARIENGRDDLRLSTIEKLAIALDVSEAVVIQAIKNQGAA